MPTVLKYIVVFGATIAAAGIGGCFLPGDWYRGLVRPPLTPPDGVFGPVWTILYLSMALAASLVWQHSPREKARLPLLLYGVQLALNALWSVLFFGCHLPGWALVDLVLLWWTIAATAYSFFRRYKPAGLSLWPYLGWVTFAGYLNAGFWWLNR